MKRPMIALSAAVFASFAAAGVFMSGSVQASSPAPARSAGATAYKVDTVHSSLLFKIKHANVAWFYGRFNEFEGSYTLDPESPESGSIQLTVKAESVDSANKKRDDHLRSPDFFSAKEFPTITFTSSSIARTGENTFEATGDFTLHGVTKQITVPVEFTGKAQGRQGELSGIHSVFTFKRSDYGMNFMVGAGLGDEVTIIASMEGKAAN